MYSRRTAAPAPCSSRNLTLIPPRGGMRNEPATPTRASERLNAPSGPHRPSTPPLFPGAHCRHRSSRGCSRSQINVRPVRPCTGTPTLTGPFSHRSISTSHFRFTWRSKSSNARRASSSDTSRSDSGTSPRVTHRRVVSSCNTDCAARRALSASWTMTVLPPGGGPAPGTRRHAIVDVSDNRRMCSREMNGSASASGHSSASVSAS